MRWKKGKKKEELLIHSLAFNLLHSPMNLKERVRDKNDRNLLTDTTNA
jgi:hypothetical protein